MKTKGIRDGKTKRGAASFYVVIFVMLLLSVITVSFVRIMISEFGQTSEDDMSQSAYDAALAGIEDSKTAVAQYQKCIANDDRDISMDRKKEDCAQNYGQKLFVSSSASTEEQCKSVATYLGKTVNGATDVQVGDDSADQAYTCTILDNTLADYRATLTAEKTSKMVPLKAANLAGVKSIKLSWYSSENGWVQGQRIANDNYPYFDTSSNKTVPPVLSATLVTSGNNIYSTMVLHPSSGGSNNINTTAVNDAGDESKQNNSFEIKCNGTDFACQVTIDIPNPTAMTEGYLFVMLPYGETATDVRVEMYSGAGGSGDVVEFVDAQVSADVTGRTNNFYRRVESRIELTDTTFPYPEYALEVNGDETSGVTKNFWVTAGNCWSSDGVKTDYNKTCPTSSSI